jgi:hypothetical protein
VNELNQGEKMNMEKPKIEEMQNRDLLNLVEDLQAQPKHLLKNKKAWGLYHHSNNCLTNGLPGMRHFISTSFEKLLWKLEVNRKVIDARDLLILNFKQNDLLSSKTSNKMFMKRDLRT